MINAGLYTNTLYESRISALFIQHLLYIDEISDTIINKFVTELRNIDPSTPEKISTILNNLFVNVGIDKPHQQCAVFSILMDIPTRQIKTIEEQLSYWVNICPENSLLFPTDKLQRILAKLAQLNQTFPYIERIKKRKRLQRATGLHLEGIETIVDIRPILGDDNFNLEDYIFNTTVKLRVKDSDRKTRNIEIIIDEDILDEFLTKLLKIRVKLSSIQEHLYNQEDNNNEYT